MQDTSNMAGFREDCMQVQGDLYKGHLCWIFENVKGFDKIFMPGRIINRNKISKV